MHWVYRSIIILVRGYRITPVSLPIGFIIHGHAARGYSMSIAISKRPHCAIEFVRRIFAIYFLVYLSLHFFEQMVSVKVVCYELLLRVMICFVCYIWFIPRTHGLTANA